VDVLNVTVFAVFWDIALIRATCRSEATWRAAEESRSLGSVDRRAGIAIARIIDAIPIVRSISTTVKPEVFRPCVLSVIGLIFPQTVPPMVKKVVRPDWLQPK